MKKIYFFIALAAIVSVASVSASFYFWQAPEKQIACTMEAKLCSDGSYVSRSGPNCEFGTCPKVKPDIKGNGIIQGKVSVGPICPVEQVGVPCPVPPEAYTSREVILYAKDGITVVKRMHFLADGTYYFQVSAGVYVLNTPSQGIGNSSDLPKTVTINSGETKNINFSIDTGIR